jgi:hypothetical protein
MKKKPRNKQSKTNKPAKQARVDPCLKYKVKEGVYSRDKPRTFKPLKRGDVVKHTGSALVKKGSIWVVEGQRDRMFPALYSLRGLHENDAVNAWRCKVRKIAFEWPNAYAAETFLRMRESANKFVPKTGTDKMYEWQKSTLRRLIAIEEMETGAVQWQLNLRRRLGKAGVKWQE